MKIIPIILISFLLVGALQAAPNPVSIARNYYKIVGAKYLLIAYKESECGNYIAEPFKGMESGINEMLSEINTLLNEEQKNMAKEMLGPNNKTVSQESSLWLNNKLATLKAQYKNKDFACGLTLGLLIPMLEEAQYRKLKIINKLSEK